MTVEARCAPFEPAPALLAKIGSIARHVEEAIGPGGHHLDLSACEAMLADSEVVEWMAAMDAMALLPVKR
jgi:hypothetical protein